MANLQLPNLTPEERAAVTDDEYYSALLWLNRQDAHQCRLLAALVLRHQSESGDRETIIRAQQQELHALRARIAELRAWKDAVDHELVLIESTADSFATPAEALTALLNWHSAVALDPAVSPDAAALHARIARLEAVDAAARSVCWFDWSDNDSDAVAAIEALSEAINIRDGCPSRARDDVAKSGVAHRESPAHGTAQASAHSAPEDPDQLSPMQNEWWREEIQRHPELADQGASTPPAEGADGDVHWFVRRNKANPVGEQWEVVKDWGGDMVSEDTRVCT